MEIISPLVSVIIPVYNVRPYLSESLDSVISQTYRNLEIIIVDDGSTDGSGEICDAYQKKDERIQVFYQSNRGLSAARNVGLDLMKGDIVSFLDSDDVFLPDMIEKMIQSMLASSADIVMCGFFICYTAEKMRIAKNTRRFNLKDGLLSSKETLNGVFKGKINIHVWNKLYRSFLFDGLRFQEGGVYEDSYMTLNLIGKAENIRLIGSCLLIYRKRPDSITETHDENNMLDWFGARLKREKFISERIPSVFDYAQLNEVMEINFKDLIVTYSYHLRRNVLGSDVKTKFETEIRNRAENLRAYRFKTRLLYQMYILNPSLVCCVRDICLSVKTRFLQCRDVLHNLCSFRKK